MPPPALPLDCLSGREEVGLGVDVLPNAIAVVAVNVHKEARE